MNILSYLVILRIVPANTHLLTSAPSTETSPLNRKNVHTLNFIRLGLLTCKTKMQVVVYI